MPDNLFCKDQRVQTKAYRENYDAVFGKQRRIRHDRGTGNKMERMSVGFASPFDFLTGYLAGRYDAAGNPIREPKKAVVKAWIRGLKTGHKAPPHA